MKEDELRKLLPAYGDTISLMNFARRSCSTAKCSLIERLKLKMKNKNEKPSSSRISQVSKKRTATKTKKSTRLVEIGWLCFNNNDGKFRQVRSRYGGGNKRISIEKNKKCSEILDIAKSLFFPNGVSTKGPIEHFKLELVDYKNHYFNQDLNIEEMYNFVALGTLRFYLASTRITEENNEKDDNYLTTYPLNLSPKPRRITRSLLSATITSSEGKVEESTESEAYSTGETNNVGVFLNNYDPLLCEVSIDLFISIINFF